jgi:hypothetical protein
VRGVWIFSGATKYECDAFAKRVQFFRVDGVEEIQYEVTKIKQKSKPQFNEYKYCSDKMYLMHLNSWQLEKNFTIFICCLFSERTFNYAR